MYRLALSWLQAAGGAAPSASREGGGLQGPGYLRHLGETRPQEPTLHSRLVPWVVLRHRLLGGCICLDFSPSLSHPGPQASRHQFCPHRWLLSAAVTSLCSLWAPPFSQLLRPCCRLNSTSSPNQRRICRAPEAGELPPRTEHQAQSCKAPTGARTIS
uniref:Uncharacterized protein n=1 Tax=Molossus molossus TaxID=27622 RepID=A0A7J8BYI8_MOLMO|nr:hypothetical protein HJG59_010065 [Molossus molossus]